MKKVKRIINTILSITIIVGIISSCTKDFLEEEQITALDTDYYTTEAGLDDLITGIYQSLKFHFNYEWSYTTTNYGADEFCVGGDRTMEMWNSYNTNLNSLTDHASVLWDNMYGNINSCNIAIQNIPEYYVTSTTKNTRLGEAYFMRAFDYFKLVKQYGGVPIKLYPSTSVEFEFTRNTAEEVYAQVISDFTQATILLPETPAETGRITKWAAQHFLAKAYLFRASELNNDWNSSFVDNDLNMAIKYADSVINCGYHSLAKDYAELWNFTEVDGPNELLPEIILAAQFSNNTATQGRYGNQIHLYYPSIYQTLPGMTRDISGGREFQRMRSTDYALDVFDRVNDSRFWKSYKTRYLCNNPSGAPVWAAGYAPSAELDSTPRFAGGEDAILYIINNAGDNRYTTENIKYRAPHMFIRYFQGESEDLKGGHGNYEVSRFVALSKFCDGSRDGIKSQFGQRDGILARLAETYMIAAEAYGRLGNYDAALPYINALRDRAAYVDGEDRSTHTDGGAAWANNPVANTAEFVSYSNKNTYFESNNIGTTTASTLSAMHLNSTSDIFNSTKDFYDELGASSDADKFMQFILNERSRELMGELMRWEDLARTKTLVLRATTFNDEANPDANKHYLRPIPQDFLDLVRKDGHVLTASEKQAMQNPGW